MVSMDNGLGARGHQRWSTHLNFINASFLGHSDKAPDNDYFGSTTAEPAHDRCRFMLGNIGNEAHRVGGIWTNLSCMDMDTWVRLTRLGYSGHGRGH